MASGEIIVIDNICYSNTDKSSIIIGKEFFLKEPLCVLPCLSSYLGIHKVSKLPARQNLKIIPVSQKFKHPDSSSSVSVLPQHPFTEGCQKIHS